jgi:hypothetical protein
VKPVKGELEGAMKKKAAAGWATVKPRRFVHTNSNIKKLKEVL